MKIESKQGGRVATFEIDSGTGLTEYSVAISALGLMTAEHADDPAKRHKPAMLALLLGKEANDRNPPHHTSSPPKPVTIDLGRQDAHALHIALCGFADSTEADILRAPRSQAPVRAREGELAETMIANLREAYTLNPPAPKQPFGFR